MSIILNRLSRSLQLDLHHSKDIATTIKTTLVNHSRSELIAHHAQINIEYNILCSKIAVEWTTCTDRNDCLEQITAALKVAELLEVIYRDYLDVPREVDRLQKEKQAMQHALGLIEQSISIEPKTYPSKIIRETTSLANFPRLLSLRCKRLFLAIAKIMDESSDVRKTILDWDTQYAAPFFSSLACVYFIPRIADNLAMIIKHTIEHDGMSEEEKALSWQARFSIQLHMRWPDLANDIPWLIANCVSYLVLVGPLAIYGSTLNIGMQLYEVVQAAAQYFVETHQLNQQRCEYVRLLNETIPGSPEYIKIQSYIAHLDDRITYESKRLWIPIVNTTILLVAIILAAPIFSPGLAVAGGIMAVSTTIASYLWRKHLEGEKPGGNLFQILESQAPLTPPIQSTLFHPPNHDTSDRLHSQQSDQGWYNNPTPV